MKMARTWNIMLLRKQNKETQGWQVQNSNLWIMYYMCDVNHVRTEKAPHVSLILGVLQDREESSQA